MRNIQWSNACFAIDSNSIEWLGNRGYYILANTMLETNDRGRGLHYDWPVHLAEKPGFPLEQFEEAFRMGLVLLKKKLCGVPDMEMVDFSFKEAREMIMLDAARRRHRAH